MNKLLSDKLWDTITKLSKKAKCTKVAVAYLGNNATKTLHLKEGDILVVAMSEDNLKCGQVNPFELEKYLNKKVRIFNKPNLHSKIYIFDYKAIISSANISINSSTRKLEECGLLTDDATIINSANKLIRKYCIREILAEDIIFAKKIYSAPKSGIQGSEQNNSEKKSLWIIGTKLHNVSPKEEEELDSTRNYFLNKVKDKSDFEIEDYRVYKSDRIAKAAQEGHRIIDLSEDRNRTLVYKPALILGVSHLYSSGNPFIRVAIRKNQEPKKWKDFSRLLKNINLSKINSIGCHEIKDQDKQDKIDSFFKF